MLAVYSTFSYFIAYCILILMRGYNSDIFLKPGSSDGRKYCDKYGIILSRLENGITIFGVSCNKDAAVFAGIRFEFQGGAFCDPRGWFIFWSTF